MGSKKYKNKLCVYCVEADSVTADHVIAREFFPVEARDGLPKAPACKKCNGGKSKLEHYLQTVLPFASDHPVARQMFVERIDGRLAKNPRLHRHLAKGRSTTWTPDDSGIFLPALSIPIEPSTLTEYFSMVAQGLLWHHWKELLDTEHNCTAMALTNYGVDEWLKRFLPDGATNLVNCSFADGAFRYRGRRSEENPKMSVWLIEFYGGIHMSGSGNDSGHKAKIFGAITARTRIFDNARRIAQFAL